MKKFITNPRLLAITVIIILFSISQFSFAREKHAGWFSPAKTAVSTKVTHLNPLTSKPSQPIKRDNKEDDNQIKTGEVNSPKPRQATDKPKEVKHSYMPADVTNYVYRSGPGGVKKIALTFDDGPDMIYTPAILEILRQENVKATFFVIGQRAERYPDIIRTISEEGHSLGNHTWSHVNLATAANAVIRSQIERTGNVLASIVGYSPSLVRPPFGSTSITATKEVNNIGCQVVTWSVDTRDWQGVSTEKMMDYIHKQLRPGGIILMHSSGGKNGKLDNTVAALPEIIAALREQGYEFVTVPELLGLGL